MDANLYGALKSHLFASVKGFTAYVTCLPVALLVTCTSFSQTIQLGSGTYQSYYYNPSPVTNYYGGLHMQFIYTASEIHAAGITGNKNLTRIGFYIVQAPTNPLPGFTIKMKHTTDSTSANFVAGPYTTVYNVANYTPIAGGFDTLTLQVPFTWNGVDNILVDICFDIPTYSGTGSVRVYNTFTYQEISYQYDYSDPVCNTATVYNYYTKPHAVMTFATPPANDAGIAAIESPSLPFTSGNNQVKAKLTNYGSNTLTSATINWEINGVAQTPYSWSGSLSAGASESAISLGTYSFASLTSYTIKAWSSNPNGASDGIPQNDTSSVEGLYTCLNSGTYTIGGTSPDFATFNTAVNAFRQGGICGPVVFNVRNGTYTEHFVLPPIVGTSAVNTITFQSESGDSSMVTLNYDSNYDYDSNYVIRFTGSDHFIFRKLTIQALNSSYARVIVIEGGSDENSFENNRLTGYSTTSTSSDLAVVFSSGDTDNENHFKNNRIINGSYGIYFAGESDENATIMEGNSFENQYYIGIYVYQQQDLQLVSNSIHSTNTYSTYRSIYSYDCSGNLIIRNNRITIPRGYGIDIISYYSSTGPGALIANNFITVGGTGTSYGLFSYYNNNLNIYHNSINITGTSTTNGIALYLSEGYTNGVDVVNNILANHGGGYACYTTDINDIGTSDYNDLFTTGSNLAYYGGNLANLAAWQTATGLDSNSISEPPNFAADTDLHVNTYDLDAAATPLSSVTTDIDGQTRNATTPDIGADEFTLSGLDIGITALSSPAAPFAAGSNDVAVKVKNFGGETVSSFDVAWKFNGAAQTTYNWTGTLSPGQTVIVTIGTKSFSLKQAYRLKMWTSPTSGNDFNHNNDTLEKDSLYAGLGGTYTIGGTSPDFDHFAEAATQLNHGGVYSAVTFNVRAGTYSQRMVLNQMTGSSLTNTITFQSESGDSTGVILEFDGDYQQPQTVLLNGADHVTFRHITIKGLDYYYARAVELVNGAHHIKLLNNVFIGSTYESSTESGALIYSTSTTDTATQIKNNRFENGSYGVNLYSSSASSSRERGCIIESNRFNNQYYSAVFLQHLDAPVVKNNTLYTHSNNSGFLAFYGYNLINKTTITGNNFIIPNGSGYGIYFYYCDATSDAHPLVANNFVSIGGNYTSYGIYLYNNDYLDLYYNTVNIFGAHSSSSALSFGYGNSNLNLVNNILANTGGGKAVHTQTTTPGISTSDYNDLFTSGSVLGYYNSADRNTLSDWQSATSKDANSISVNPLFVADTDLHVRHIDLNAAATVLSTITTDIDGETRNAFTPDIGADEFIPIAVDAGVVAIDSPSAPFPAGNNDVWIRIKNFGLSTLTSLTINWELNDTPKTTHNWTGSLLAGEEESVNVGSYHFTAFNSFAIKAWTSQPNGTTDGLEINDTAFVKDLYAALLGTYTLGGSSPDIDNFNEAATNLNKGGVLGDVTINVRNGTYTEQVIFNAIPGASASNSVVFQSETGDSSQAILTNSTADYNKNYTVLLDGTDYLSFSRMTLKPGTGYYAIVVNLKGGASNNTFKNNILQGSTSTSSGSDQAIIFSDNSSSEKNNSFTNNRFVNGSSALYLYSSSSDRETGLIIQNNSFENQYYYAVYGIYWDGVQITGNTISTNSAYSGFYGMLLYYTQGNYLITQNSISVPVGYGMYLYDVNSGSATIGLIANNFINIAGGDYTYGIYSYSGDYLNIYHNNISMGSGCGANSVAFYPYYGSSIRMKNNIFSNAGSGYAVYSANSSSISESDYNDLFSNGTNLAYWNSGNRANLAALQASSGMDIHSISSDPLFVSTTDLHVRQIDLDNAGTPITSVTTDFDGEARNATTPDIGADEFVPVNTDDGVVSFDAPVVPFAAGSNNVFVTVKNFGLDTLESVNINWTVNGVAQTAFNWTGSILAGNTLSINIGSYNFVEKAGYDLVFWTSDPNLQADEDMTNDSLSKENLYAALSGSYTIGGSSPDFAFFTDAVTALNFGGILGPVTFNARSGSYTEQFSIRSITGASATDTILFQSEGGDSSAVTLTYNQNNFAANYTVQLDGADYITFKKITITNISSGSYRRVIELKNNTSNINFLNNQLFGTTSLTSGSESSVIYSSSNDSENNLNIRNNYFKNGSYGIHLIGISSSPSTGIAIVNNTFSNCHYTGIYLEYLAAPVITGNTILSSSGYYYSYGLNMSNCSGKLSVQQNDISMRNGYYGIYLYNCDATSGNKGTLANNFVYVGGSYDGYGMYLYSCDHQNLYYNTVNVNNSYTYSKALVIEGGASNSINLVNNIFAATQNGYAYYIGTTAALSTSDYNDLFTAGSTLAYWSGDRAGLAALQTASSKDVHSFSDDPQFLADTNLHIRNVNLDSAATPIAGITVDIDGEARDATFPDIGADEFLPVDNDIGIIKLLSPASGCSLSNTEQVTVRIRNFGTMPQTGFDVSYKFMSNPPVTENVGALTIQPGTTVNYTFAGTLDLDTLGAYKFVAYTGLAGDENKLNDTLKVTVTHHPDVVPVVTPNDTICEGSSIYIQASGGATYQWSDGVSGCCRYVSPIVTTKYKVTVTASYGCTAQDSVTIYVKPKPTAPVASAGGPTTICQGDSLTLTSNIDTNIQWNNGKTTKSIVVKDAGAYYVTYTGANGCPSNSNTISVNIVPKPNLIASKSLPICLGTSITLSVQNGTTYSWSTSSTSSSITVSPTDTTTYYVTATNALSCSYSDSITVTVIDPPVPGIVSNMLPADSAGDVSQPIQFSWFPATDADKYDLYVWLDSLSQPSTPVISNINSINATYSASLLYGKLYKWFIVSKNACKETAGPIQHFRLRQLPDLIAENVQSPASAFSEQTISVSWEVKNKGDGNTGSQQWHDVVYLSNDASLDVSVDTYLGGITNESALNPGQSYSASETFKLPQGISGNYYLFVWTDRYNYLLESDNNNNTAKDNSAMVVTLTTPPDLIVQSIVTPGNAFSGQPINVSWTVKNDNAGSAGTYWYDRVYLSTDTFYNPGNSVYLGDFYHGGNLEQNETYTETKSFTLPQGIFGTYYIYVNTDQYNHVYEHVFESNNNKQSNALNVILTPPTDFVVTNVSIDDSASNKETKSVSWTVENQGGSAPNSSYWYDRLYLTTAADTDLTNALDVGTVYHSDTIDPGENYTASAAITIPDNISGPYYLYVKSDFYNQVYEYNLEGNNIGRSNATIRIIQPDLVVSTVVVPALDSSGSTMMVEWNVKNNGPGVLFNTTRTDRVMISSSAVYNAGTVTELGQFSFTESLLPGAISTTKQQQVTIPNGSSGTKYIYIHTDYVHTVFEGTLENNNVSTGSSMQVYLTPWADLQVSALQTRDTATAGTVMSFEFSISNEGVAKTEKGSWKDKVYLSTHPTYDSTKVTLLREFQRSEFLYPDSSYHISSAAGLPSTLAGGTYYLYVYTDRENKIYEHTDEGNNIRRSDPIYIKEYPPVDLTVTDVTVPDSVASGRQANVKWTVRNIGEAVTLPAFWYDAIYLSTDTIWNRQNDTYVAQWKKDGPLVPGGAYSNNQNYTIPDGTSGNYYTLLVTDHSNLNNDEDTTNNYKIVKDSTGKPVTTKITLTPPPDLTIVSFTAPSKGTAGQQIKVKWTVKNKGTGATAGSSWTEKFYLSTDVNFDGYYDATIGSFVRNNALTTGQSYGDSLMITIPIWASGNYIIFMKTDDNNVIYEYQSENNNTASVFISITQPPPSDLIVSSITIPANAIAGDPLTVNWQTKNIGTNPATGSIKEAVYLSKDTIWDINDKLLGTATNYIDLTPQASVNRSLTADLTGVSLGNYYMLVTTDILNNIYESSDTNNTSASATTIQVDVNKLPLFVLTPATLDNNTELYYRIEIPDSLEGESLIIILKGDSVNGSNEFYLRFSDVPTRVTYDFSHENPYQGNQEIIIPELHTGTYYLMIYGNTSSGGNQSITLFADILDFEIRHVEAGKGGNTGQVTIEVKGSKFEETMLMRLENATDTIAADSIFFVDPTKVFAIFNLTGSSLGMYHVTAEKAGNETATLLNGFEIEAGEAPNLLVNVINPASTRPSSLLSINIQFTNAGNTDLINPVLVFTNQAGAPISFNIEGLQNQVSELQLVLEEINGPPGRLRPGVIGSITVYSKATTSLSYTLMLPNFD